MESLAFTFIDCVPKLEKGDAEILILCLLTWNGTKVVCLSITVNLPIVKFEVYPISLVINHLRKGLC